MKTNNKSQTNKKFIKKNDELKIPKPDHYSLIDLELMLNSCLNMINSQKKEENKNYLFAWLFSVSSVIADKNNNQRNFHDGMKKCNDYLVLERKEKVDSLFNQLNKYSNMENPYNFKFKFEENEKFILENITFNDVHNFHGKDTVKYFLYYTAFECNEYLKNNNEFNFKRYTNCIELYYKMLYYYCEKFYPQVKRGNF